MAWGGSGPRWGPPPGLTGGYPPLLSVRAIWLEWFGSRGRSGQQGQGEIPAEQLERSVGGDVLRADLVGRAADLDLLGDSDFESALPREGTNTGNWPTARWMACSSTDRVER